MKTAKNLALLSMIFVTVFAATQINAFGIVESALNTAGNIAEDATIGAADITSATVGGPYIGRRAYYGTPVVVEGEEIYKPAVQPGGMVEETYETQVEPGEMIEDPGY